MSSSYRDKAGVWRTKSTTAMIREAEEKRQYDAEMARHRGRGAVLRAIEEDEPVARELVGNTGHWIEERERGNDGRVKFAVFSPDGELLCMKWGKDTCERAAKQHAAGEMITA